MSAGFAIPYARNASGDLMPPEHAVKGDAYTCPCCNGKVIFKSGAVISPHFAHEAGGVCGETIYHKLAKLFFIQAVKDWKAGKGNPIEIDRLDTHDPGCKDRARDLKKLFIPDKVADAVEEYRLPCGFIADVALLDMEGAPVCSIEFYATHRVDAYKGLLISVPFIEVSAWGYVSQADKAYIKPIGWKSINGIKPACKECARISALQAEAQARREKWERFERERRARERARQEEESREYWRTYYKIPEHLRDDINVLVMLGDRAPKPAAPSGKPTQSAIPGAFSAPPP